MKLGLILTSLILDLLSFSTDAEQDTGAPVDPTEIDYQLYPTGAYHYPDYPVPPHGQGGYYPFRPYERLREPNPTRGAEPTPIPQRLGQAIFISGGASWQDGYSTTEVLDLEGSTCSRTTADLPDARPTGHTSHLYRNNVVICGGKGYPIIADCIASSSPTTGDWRIHSNGPSRRYHSGTVVGDRIYLVFEDRLLYWDGQRWQAGPQPPEDFEGSCTVRTSPTTILVIGGKYGHESTISIGLYPNWPKEIKKASKKVVELDINTGKWRYLPDMKQGRHSHSCTLVGRKVVVAGGRDPPTCHYNQEDLMDCVRNGNERYKNSEILDLDTEEWSRAGDLTTSRAVGAQMVTVTGRVVILGGGWGERPNGGEDTVEELDMEQRTWRRLAVKMKMARSDFAATVMDKKVLCN